MEMVMDYVDHDDAEEQLGVNPTEGYVVTVLLSFLCVTGTAGNALVLYVFSRRTDRLVSTLFILSLAVVDFTTCSIVVPFTIYMEHVGYEVDVDIICKLYHFLITCNVPFSAMVMVAIAIDRYFCICHPWMNAITSRSAKRIVVGLALLAVCIGACVACMHGIYHPYQLCRDDIANASTATNIFSPNVPSCYTYNTSHEGTPPPRSIDLCSPLTDDCTTVASPLPESTLNSSMVHATPSEPLLIMRNVKTSMCAKNNLILTDEVQFYYHKLHNSIFAACFFAVIFLYVAIYRSVLKRRRKRQRESRRNIPTDTYVVLTRSVVAGDTPPSVVEPKVRLSLKPIENSPSDVGESPRRPRFQPPKPSYDGNLVANMRTAAMLFVVTVVFMITFLPAWLMIMGWVTFDRIAFYLYFANNAANPVIYSFMNRNFRESLKRLLWRKRFSDRPSGTDERNGRFKRSKAQGKV